MATASVDVKELPASYVFVADVPGLKNTDIKVQIENDSILKISGERKREDNPSYDIKYVRVERAVGKFMRKFNLPANANLEAVAASCQDGILTVTVPKIPPPEPHQPKTFDIAVASTAADSKK
ncbi:17.3 kDa class II heat shock protein-like [Selaginella moellendorffii]|nr:17.3 kDa class II heat shock protein [Selaginella moellendorffii]XP_024527564.1 17.3 kDa class II heat shock protein-like [Selaginella moellendorffii]|eukprot:XP_002960432.2 17.3 kDa class II heat shock protein [Selaginella moellendorffii]